MSVSEASIKFDYKGQSIIMSIRAPHSGQFNQDELQAVARETFNAWRRAYACIVQKIDVEFPKQSPEQIVFGDVYYDVSKPLVTVFNRDNRGMSITAHSNDAGYALCVAGHALAGFLDEQFPPQAPTTSNMPADVSGITQSQPQAPHHAPPAAPNSKALAASAVSGLRKIEMVDFRLPTGQITQQPVIPNKKGAAMPIIPASTSYDYNAVNYLDGERVAYQVAQITTSTMTVNGASKWFIDLHTTHGRIRVFQVQETVQSDGKSFKTDWGKLLDSLNRLSVSGKDLPVTVAPELKLWSVFKISHAEKDNTTREFHNFHTFVTWQQ